MLPFPFDATFQSAIDLAYAHQAGLNNGSDQTELLICISADGTFVIDAAVGEMDRVELTPKMVTAANSLEGCRLVHNHPTASSLSAADWKMAETNSGILEIVAVNYRKSVFRGAIVRPVDAAFTSFIVSSDLSADVGDYVFQPYWDQFNAKLAAGQLTPDPSPLQDALNWIWSHLINERYQLNGYVIYSSHLAPEDLVQLESANFAPFIQEGRKRIAELIP